MEEGLGPGTWGGLELGRGHDKFPEREGEGQWSWEEELRSLGQILRSRKMESLVSVCGLCGSW